MQIKNQNKKLFKYYFVIITLQILLYLIRCEDCSEYKVENNKCIKEDSSDSLSNCRPHKEDGKCYYCLDSTDTNYYILNNGSCIKIDKCENKIIYETKECVGHCPSKTYELGDYCYDNCYENKNMIENFDIPFKSCKCKGKYIINIVEGKKKYDCLEDSETCKNKNNNYFYDSDTKECVLECKDKKIFDFKDDNDNVIERRCSSKCNFNENEKINGNNCVKECPLYFYKDIDNAIYCVEECKNGYFYSDNKECLSECNSPLLTVFDEKMKCTKNKDEHLYNYNNILFKNCSFTQTIFNVITYNYENENTYKCVEKCEKDFPFIDLGYNCKKECDYYYYNKICLTSCYTEDMKHIFSMNLSIIDSNGNTPKNPDSYSNLNYIDLDLSIFPNEKECLEDCPINTYKDNDTKQCYISNCEEGKYINSNLECIKECNNPIDSNLEQLKERYIVKKVTIIKHNDNYYNITKNFCLPSCPNFSPYHNKNNNECYDKPCKERNEYSAFDNPYICYNSCAQINGEYNYEKDFVCYKTQITCDSYYYIKDNLTKCLKYEECLNNFDYIKGKECTNNCSFPYYRIEKILNNIGETQNIGGCFLDPNDCINEGYPYFNNKERICQKTCDKYKLSGTEIIKNEDGETCFENCPSNYPFKDDTKKICFLKCPKFFYENICLDSCADKGYFYFNNTNECLENCTKDGISYYKMVKDDGENFDNICYFSCNENFPYLNNSIKKENEPYICTKNCSTFYYKDKKICIDSCDILYGENNECLYQCKPGEKVSIVNGEKRCVKLCNKKIIKDRLPGASSLMEICVDECNITIYPFISGSNDNYCLKECPPSESYKYNNTCYNKCPEDTYIDEINKECSDTICHGQNFYIKNEKNKICKTKCPLDKFILSEEGGECLNECPEEKNFIGKNNLCLSNCSSELNKFAVKIDKKNNYSIYKCSPTCGDNLMNYDNNTCIDKCGPGYYESPNKICYSKCILDKDNPFSTMDENGNFICDKKCNSSHPNFLVEEKKCTKGCESFDDKNIIDYDGACVSKCENQYYKFSDNSTGIFKCVIKCPEEKRQHTKINKCVEKCESPFNYVEENECKIGCDSKHQFSRKNDKDEIICLTECDSTEYYYDSGPLYNQKKCKSKCDDNDFLIENTHICTRSCPISFYSYYYDQSDNSSIKNNTCVLKCPSDKPYNDLQRCVNECPISGNKFHIFGQKNCLPNCPSDTVANGNECLSICPNGTFLYKSGNLNNCVDKCPPLFSFYVPGENVCLNQCDKKYKIKGKECVISCDDTYYYKNNNTCIDFCPENENYVVQIYNLGENESYIPNECLNDCPEDYPYYFDIKIDEQNIIHICKSQCNYKGKKNNEKNSIKCLEKCNEEDNLYYDSEKGQCSSSCNNSYYVEKKNNEQIYYECYKECPNNYPYLKNSSVNECTNICENDKYIDYQNKVCVEKCNINQKNFIEQIKDGTYIKYCINNCTDLGLYVNFDNCVKECNISKYFIPNMATKTCECINLFYIDENGEKKCQDPSTSKCPPNYYRYYNSYECLNDCKNGTLSVDKDICYSENYECPSNSHRVNASKEKFKYKCECSYNYYEDNNTTICLGEKEVCPKSYPYLIQESKKCVIDCEVPYNIKFDNKCLRKENFEGLTDIKDNEIYTPNCGENYYFDGEIYHCNNDIISCTKEDKKYYIEDLKICVNECSGKYYIYDFLKNIKKCVSNCSQDSRLLEFKNESKIIYKCICKNKWYEESEDKMICSNDTNEKCEEINTNYTFYIKKTNQCVKECPGEYSYSFNDECFTSCEEAKYDYGYNVIKNEKNKCVCENLWIKKDGKIECIEDEFCNKENYDKLVDSNRECTSNCPNNTFEFNHICYSKDKCPENTKEDNNKCNCINLWYKYKSKIYNEDNFIYCLSNDTMECPYDTHPYLIVDTNECVKNLEDCESSGKIFNYMCYNTCPNNTKEKVNSNECECEQNKPWYQYIKNGKKYLKCGIDNCLHKEDKLNIKTNECLSFCNPSQYYYKGNCYDVCPDNTKLIDSISRECTEFITFNDKDNLESLDEFITENLKENIYPLISKGGIVYNINNSTLQIYGVNKKRTTSHELIMRSNLTYIDISKCIDKLYEKNNLNDNDDIIIVKYDIGDKTDSMTINPVEFKLINSNTGKVISMDACEDNSIIISYPLSNILNNYPQESKNIRYLQEENNLNLREKFLKGKELNLEDQEIDSFNFENKLYTDMCYPFKLNGKDLILEDRVNYLFPSFIFCENNCIYNSTDFNLERIVCLCNPKKDVNFERSFVVETTEIDIENIKNKQKDSLLKCLFKISNINKNFGFFYGIIILFAEIGMMILTLLYNYKIFNLRIKRKFDIKKDINNLNNNTENDKNEKNKLDTSKKIKKKKNEEIIKTTERNLENPPKKNNFVNNNNKNVKEDKKKNISVQKKNQLDDKEMINIQKLNINKNFNDEEKEDEKDENASKISSSDSVNIYNEKSSALTMKDLEDENIFNLIKNEEMLLRIDYSYALRKNNAEIIIMIITEILDKIYLLKAIWFLQKYEIFSLYFSLYLLWHMLLLSFLCLFYNNSTLHKIWIKDNYPDLNYYLLFGFVSSIISFIIYKVLSFLINNEKKIKEINSLPKDNTNEIYQKYNKMMYWSKIKIIIFYIVQYILLIIFFLYLISFCGIYNGTQKELVESYGIALIEVVIIKILYGLILGILRKISLTYEINKLYSIVLFLDLYIS